MRVAAVSLGVVLVMALASALAPQPVGAQADEAGWLFAQINALRQRNGETALAANPQLTAAAVAHSTYLATHPYGDPHTEANGSTPQSRAQAAGYPGGFVGENVVGGTGANVQWALNWWMQSPIHLRNMLSSWTEVGVGIAQGPYGRWYTLDFGRSGAGLAPPPAATAIPASPGANPAANSPGRPAAKPTLPPTRRPTRVPTRTPTITLTPSITYTPRPTFTPSLTPTRPPPTGTPIVLEVTPGAAVAENLTPGLADTSAPDGSGAHQAVAMLQTAALPPPPAASGPGDTIRSLIPWALILQAVVVGGLLVGGIIRRRR
jgi:hypothetical protein